LLEKSHTDLGGLDKLPKVLPFDVQHDLFRCFPLEHEMTIGLLYLRQGPFRFDTYEFGCLAGTTGTSGWDHIRVEFLLVDGFDRRDDFANVTDTDRECSSSSCLSLFLRRSVPSSQLRCPEDTSSFIHEVFDC
jgi:hypothetical protein